MLGAIVSSDLVKGSKSMVVEVTYPEVGRVWQCTECSYYKVKKDHVVKHVEGRHANLEISCVYCGLVFKRRDVYRQHVKKKHHDSHE